jgi:hypothetical protein
MNLISFLPRYFAMNLGAFEVLPNLTHAGGAVDISMFHHNAKPLKHPQIDREAKPRPIHLEYLKNPAKLHHWVEVLTQLGAYGAQSIIGKNTRVNVI